MTLRSPRAASLIALAGMLAAGATADAGVWRVGRDAPTVQAALDAAADGDVVEVPEGVWAGPVRVERAVTLRGAGGILDGGGTGTVVVVSGAGAVVEGLEIRGSGRTLSGRPDACVWVEASARGAAVRDNELRDCAFGIWINETDGAEISGNRIFGRTEQRPSDRGNGIQLFNARNLVVRGNTVTGARDGIYVAATTHSLIEGNRLIGQRYGVHYMFSYSNTLRDNLAYDNGSGFALMQSKHLTVVNNVARDNTRHGILFRDAQGCTIERNTVERNGQGLFFYSSTENRIVGNRVAGNAVGAKIWAGSLRNVLAANAFVGNRQQVFYVGTSDLVLGADGPGNFWSDYVGWDQDGDGVGDRPYRMDSFTSNVVYRYPAAGMLVHSPALELLSHLEERMPLLRTATIVDLAPQTAWRIP